MSSRKYPTWLKYCGLLCLLFVFSATTWSQDAPASSTAAGDNSKVNQRDQNKTEPTADQQQNNRSDVDVTKEIRQSITKDKSLSTYAHNVNVISQNGKVTLKGPVRSDDEKSAVEAKAAQVVGQANINDEMTVVPKHD